MRTVVLVSAIALITGFAVGRVLFILTGNLVEIRVEIRRGPASTAPEPAAVAPPDTLQSADDLSKSSQPSTTSSGDERSAAPDTRRPIIDQANRLTAAGQLPEAQELYLQVLLVDPEDREAMRGLVRVRRLMAGENPVVLRRQAEAYSRAVSQRLETGEHYTAPAMDLLAAASLLAATELEDSTLKERTSVLPPQPTAGSPTSPSKPQPTSSEPQLTSSKPESTSSKPEQASSRPQPTSSKSQPTASKPRPVLSKPKPTSQPKPKPAPRRPAAAPAPAKPAPAPFQKPPSPPAKPMPAPEPPLNVNEPFVTVTVGPIASGERASAITTELTVAGYVARVRRGVATGDYVITVGPYRRSVAERIAALIRSRFGQGIPVVLSPSS